MSGQASSGRHEPTSDARREVLTDEDLVTSSPGEDNDGGREASALGTVEAPTGDEAPGTDAETPGGGDPQLELSLVRAERDEYLDALRRLQAEFENFRKRMDRHQAELASRASEALVERLLPVLDAFDLARAHASDSGDDAELAPAFAQIGALLASALEREGLERIDETGTAFDPTVHDAVAHEEWDEGDAGRGVVVDEVLRAGYRLKGRVLRPAMVKVRG